MDTGEGAEQIEELVISRAISGLRIEWFPLRPPRSLQRPASCEAGRFCVLGVLTSRRSEWARRDGSGSAGGRGGAGAASGGGLGERVAKGLAHGLGDA